SEAREPPGSGFPRAGAGPRPRALPIEKRDAASGGGTRAGLSVSLRVPAPRSPFLVMPMSSLPVPMASLCPHGPDIPMSLRPHGPCISTVSLRCSAPYPQCSHSIPHVVPPCPQAGLVRCQREAEEVAELMRQNVARALEREGHLEQLQSRAQDLRQASEAFTRTTQTVKRRQRRRHQRWHLVALGLGLLLLFILGLALALARSSPGTVTSTVPTPWWGPSTPPSTTPLQ
ncbi:VAMP5 protein, partial [Hirundo rustica]|nr:VAMP5 protein [Hirundo rustica]